MALIASGCGQLAAEKGRKAELAAQLAEMEAAAANAGGDVESIKRQAAEEARKREEMERDLESQKRQVRERAVLNTGWCNPFQ